ncbi:agmatine deiminase family protein [Phocaeicola faecicola]|jgi:agmatine deiminase|uniref:agmatine deiminase family protein n=1 Tax=Phocaeicola faecicola TaxID=2739389 RepID=UPI002A7F247C|nr:agmatine deiminase family protein [Phocaeicola faecicola]MCI5744229.1 agmatine deiminase family protein [Bacteroides sp.]MDD6908593.1 agmatine deiminase family protein [Bacteroidaceae bacterium]MDY4871102.1 agmatine deiminase family protein [Phocaeicola faecicola]
MDSKNYFLPAEWHPQSFIQLTWPHQDTDWSYMLDEVEECFLNLAREIASRQPLLLVAPEFPKALENFEFKENVFYVECPTNDTWARDHGFISLLNEQEEVRLVDFCFNGWGMKFAACKDNLINSQLVKGSLLNGTYQNCRNFVLEGGSIESDGEGTLLTTSLCLLAPNRNDTLDKQEIEDYLKKSFNLKQVLWLDHGYLAGDDTDSHIDTLARLCPDHTICYVQCTDTEDEHYMELKKMEEQLKEFRTLDNEPFRLLGLPMPEAIFDEDGERLPATYANFLIMNDAVLYPTYDQPENDRKAACVLQEAFPGKEIVGVDCRALIKQHGSLHCVTMQYPRTAKK